MNVTASNEGLALFSILLHASFVVQLVMLLLLAASLISWTMIFRKWSTFKSAALAASRFESRFWHNFVRVTRKAHAVWIKLIACFYITRIWRQADTDQSVCIAYDDTHLIRNCCSLDFLGGSLKGSGDKHQIIERRRPNCFVRRKITQRPVINSGKTAKYWWLYYA